jgi:uncharacterized protein
MKLFLTASMHLRDYGIRKEGKLKERKRVEFFTRFFCGKNIEVNMKLENMKIVITGANSGIGLAVMKILMEKEGNLIVAADREIDQLEAIKSDKIIPYKVDVSSEKAVDDLFNYAIDKIGGIDFFFANAGYAYYEEMNYASWQRVSDIFNTNVISPIYTYQKYRQYLDGKNGIFGITVSAIGEMAMPGFALYSATKYALNGVRQSIMMEKPDNIQLTCLYPIATETNFFKTSSPIPYKKPFPVQDVCPVAKKFVKGVEKGSKKVRPSLIFVFSKALMAICPLIKIIYLALEKRKFIGYKRDRDEILSEDI